MARRLTFVVQEQQEGYGHAVYQAKAWAGDDPCAVLLGDHVYRSFTATALHPPGHRRLRAVRRPRLVASRGRRRPLIPRLGTLAGRPLGGDPPVYEIDAMAEKPTVEQARATLRTPGLPDGEYLCFFGIHVFPPAIFECLEHLFRHDIRHKGEYQLTAAQELLFQQDRYLVSEVRGERYDMGVPEGLIETQIALALHSPFREQALAMFSESKPANEFAAP